MNLSIRISLDDDCKSTRRKWLTSSDTVCSVDKDHRQNRHVPLGLDLVVVILEVVKERVVIRVEDGSIDAREIGEDITSSGMVFTSLCDEARLSEQVRNRCR
jgi:hypothetical protein